MPYQDFRQFLDVLRQHGQQLLHPVSCNRI